MCRKFPQIAIMNLSAVEPLELTAFSLPLEVMGESLLDSGSAVFAV